MLVHGVLEKAALLLCLALVAAVANACTPDPRPLPPRELSQLVTAGKADLVFHLVDLRSDDVFGRSHLPAAVNVPYSRLDQDRMLFLDGRPVIFYDQENPDLSLLERRLGSRLPDNVVFLDGGMARWLEEGLPVERRPK